MGRMSDRTQYLFRAIYNVVARGVRAVWIPAFFLLLCIGAISIAAGDPVGIILMRIACGLIVLGLIFGAIMLFVDSVKNELENLRES